jgi:hypothetical protein
MDNSAFDLLIVPVLWGTLGSLVAGAAILGVINTTAALVGRVGRSLRSVKSHVRSARHRVPRARRVFVREVKSIG